ncbi:hypothetical protein FB45DRAFT_904913 [Roridomyces roridus]|uniref:F-box domain-containing protein n=1 Tax=Roridomyces roridus TaxID=1738132 RepID=A0AAD7C582_9AGAR|nr:hypothetical protein FB45DRAFT_904913 [Roridomyces roridus]
MDTVSSALALGGHSASYEQATKDFIRAAEENIARIESQIRDLELLRDRERSFIAALKQVAAPIRKLPAELLLEIFKHILFPDWRISERCYRLKRVLAVSHVCPHWRRLVSTTPRFWAFELLINLPKAAPSEAYLATTKLFLERSGSLAIPMVLEGASPKGSALPAIVYSSASRWSSLDFRSSQISELRKLPASTFKQLVSVDLKSGTRIPALTPIRAFMGARRLQTVHLQVANPDRYHMPWSQLTHLTAYGVDKNPQAFVDVLVQCTNLIEAKFRNMMPWLQPPPDNSSSAPVQLPRLKSLEVHFNFNECEGLVTPFFARLALPALTTLDICSYSESAWVSADFTPFQRRSPNIERLDIEGSLMSGETVVALLTNSPSLEVLSLERCFDGYTAIEAALECLVYSNTNVVHAAPRLRTINLIDQLPDVDEEVLERAIVSRWWTDTQLAALPVPPLAARWESFYLRSSEEQEQAFSEDLLARIEQLVQEGFNVCVE